jgi:hypothetical protein
MGDATAARTITVFQCVAVRHRDFAALAKLKQTMRRHVVAALITAIRWVS